MGGRRPVILHGVHILHRVHVVSNVTSRRDLNKIATHGALVRAAIDLVDERGFEAVTADAVAERAGVSRRTFFNYFPSLEDCLTSPILETLEIAVAAFEARPADEPIMVAATHAFAEAFSPERAPQLIRLMSLLRSDQRLVGSHLAHWKQASEAVGATLQRRFPDVDPLWLQTLSGSVVGVAETALSAGLALFQDDGDAIASSERLRLTVARCFEYLASGFDTPPSA